MFNPNVAATLSTAAVLFIDEWQDAADNGYGLAPWWGDATDIALLGFECLGGVLRNLVAIGWFVTLLGCNVIDAIWMAYLGYRAARRIQLQLALLPTPRLLPAPTKDEPVIKAIATAITTVTAAAAMAPVATLTISEPAEALLEAMQKTDAVLAEMKQSGLMAHTIKQLKAMAQEQGIKGYSKMRKAELVEALAA